MDAWRVQDQLPSLGKIAQTEVRIATAGHRSEGDRGHPWRLGFLDDLD